MFIVFFYILLRIFVIMRHDFVDRMRVLYVLYSIGDMDDHLFPITRKHKRITMHPVDITALNKIMLIQILTAQLVVAATPTKPVKQRHTKTKGYKFYK